MHGLEPWTSVLSGLRSNQLSYTPNHNSPIIDKIPSNCNEGHVEKADVAPGKTPRHRWALVGAVA
ncbi:MAG: hypothetical protein UZ22_OP11002000693, partial [Microgenomates bacterium OLB23]